MAPSLGADLMDAAAERAGLLVLKTLEQAGGLDALATAHETVSAHHGNNYFPLLEQHYRSHRPALFTLLDSIELQATTADSSVLDAVGSSARTATPAPTTSPALSLSSRPGQVASRRNSP